MRPEFEYLDPKSIVVRRDERQRREVQVDDLLDSIRLRGVFHPIIITKDNVLVSGERRLAATLHLGLPSIPVRYKDDLSISELQIIELEENVKRRDLPWRDTTLAIERIHNLYVLSDDDWTMERTARAIGLSGANVSKYLRVARELDSPKIAEAPGIAAAFNILTRRDERAIGDALSDIMQAGKEMFDEAPEEPVAPLTATIGEITEAAKPNPRPGSSIVPADASILNENFITWVQTYSGPTFNFIHCDFPYGINVFGGAWGGKGTAHTYEDTPDVYFRLIQALGENLDRIMSASAHLMFWFSMEHYRETLEAFRQYAPSLTFDKFPLFWHKSDNVGIMPDHNRGPRRIYETALIASREDRFVVKPVANSYSAPTDKAHHPSTKPEPVLRHFFQMFIDKNSRVFDPTCGGASALRAAESLGAEHVLGLEVDAEHCANARSALKQFRVLRSVAK